MTTRRATLKDAGAIAALHAASWRDAYAEILDPEFLTEPVDADRLEFWTDRLSKADARLHVTLAFENDAPAAFICVLTDEDPVWGGRVDNLHVSPGLRGRGIGERLLRQAAGELEREGTSPGLHLWVFESNLKARRFYERLGANAVESARSQIPSARGQAVLRLHWPDVRTLAESAQGPRG